MGLFGFIFGSSPTADAEEKDVKNIEGREALIAPKVETKQHPPVPSSRFSTSVDMSELSPMSPSSNKPSSAAAKEAHKDHGTKPSQVTRGFSFHSLAFISNGNVAKPALSTVQEHRKEARASAAFFRRRAKVPKADERATESALIVRSLIIGQSPTHPALSQSNNGFSMPQLSKVKSQLMQPKTANKVIAQLRVLSASNRKTNREKSDVEERPVGPVHAVCLDTTDVEAEKHHFSRLTKEDCVEELAAESSSPIIANTSVDKLANMFKDMHIISLVMTPDFGLGQPGDGHGMLSGAIPTVETIIDGIEQITPQLMAIGLATGNAFLPDHKGRHCLLFFFAVIAAEPPNNRCLSSNRPHFGLDMCVAPTFCFESLLNLSHRLVGIGSRTACFYPALPLSMYIY